MGKWSRQYDVSNQMSPVTLQLEADEAIERLRVIRKVTEGKIAAYQGIIEAFPETPRAHVADRALRRCYEILANLALYNL